MKKNEEKHIDKYIFFVCLATSIGLFIGGFFCPPMGVIDGSILKATGILLAFAALGVAGQNLANGKEISWQKDDINLTIGDKDSNEERDEDIN